MFPTRNYQGQIIGWIPNMEPVDMIRANAMPMHMRAVEDFEKCTPPVEKLYHGPVIGGTTQEEADKAGEDYVSGLFKQSFEQDRLSADVRKRHQEEYDMTHHKDQIVDYVASPCDPWNPRPIHASLLPDETKRFMGMDSTGTIIKPEIPTLQPTEDYSICAKEERKRINDSMREFREKADKKEADLWMKLRESSINNIPAKDTSYNDLSRESILSTARDDVYVKDFHSLELSNRNDKDSDICSSDRHKYETDCFGNISRDFMGNPILKKDSDSLSLKGYGSGSHKLTFPDTAPEDKGQFTDYELESFSIPKIPDLSRTYDDVPKIKVTEKAAKDKKSFFTRVSKESGITGNKTHVHYCPDKILLTDESKEYKDGCTWEERHPQRIYLEDGDFRISPKISDLLLDDSVLSQLKSIIPKKNSDNFMYEKVEYIEDGKPTVYYKKIFLGR